MFALLFSYFDAEKAYAVKHVVNVQNYVFVPANLNVNVGDTIRWVWINGTHTTTSTTIPVGAPAWDEPITSSNTFYEYRVAVAGTYNYLCTPHANSQIGHFTATMPAATLAVSPSNQNVGSSSGTTNFSVTSNTNWTATSNAGWCTVTPSGSGNGTLVATYQSNTNTSQRVATITVSASGAPSSTVTVTQQGAQATLAVSPANQDVTSTAGTTNFNVTSNTNWTATSDAGWCTVTPSGSGNGNLIATYQTNTSSSQRIATITISASGAPSSVVTVTQQGAQATLSVSPANQNVTSMAGSTTFSVLSNTNWLASSNADWCIVTQSGSGNGSLTAAYEENTSTSIRIATITVTAGGSLSSVVTVTQQGAQTVLLVSPANQDVTAMAGMTEFDVISNTDWIVTSSAPWADPVSEGTGSSKLAVNYEENLSSTVRVATISVTANSVIQLVTITQEGQVSSGGEDLSKIAVYPNPARDYITLSAGLKSLPATIIISEISGAEVLNKWVDNLRDVKLDLSNLIPGTYIIRATQDGRTYTTSFVVSR